MSTLEQEELIVGKTYLCETVLGLEVSLKYKGDGEFVDYLYIGDYIHQVIKELP